MSIDAVFEGGLFRPTREVALAEGTRVEVLIPQSEKIHDPKSVAARSAHDAIVYDQKHQAEKLKGSGTVFYEA